MLLNQSLKATDPAVYACSSRIPFRHSASTASLNPQLALSSHSHKSITKSEQSIDLSRILLMLAFVLQGTDTYNGLLVLWSARSGRMIKESCSLT